MKKISFITALITFMFVDMTNAQTPKNKYEENQWTLVYEGAINRNEQGKVNVHPVSYKVNGIDVAANVYTPPNYDCAKKYPTVVIAHPNGGVKEQVAGLFAQRLAEQGYITIAADAVYQGASGGKPRNTDKPQNRVEDIHEMAGYITQYKGVDKDRLGVLGICGGGGYTMKAVQSDKRFKAVATLSMFNSGMVRRNGFMNSQVATIQDRLKQASDAKTLEAAGGEIKYIGGGAAATDEEIDAMPFEMYREGTIYYQRTHAHPNSGAYPNSGGSYTVSSLIDLMSWDATDQIELINQPLLMIAGDRADSYYMTADAFNKAINAKNKELFLIKGATHIDTYWKPEFVSQELNKLLEFYNTNL